MLLVLIAVGAATTIEEETHSFFDAYYTWSGVAGWHWVIFVAGVTLITEGIMLLLRFLNPRCFNNTYGAFGGLVRELQMYQGSETVEVSYRLL